MRILVAMSGGVDSSVVACLLREQGHEVIGVHFRLWQDPRAPAEAQILPSKCCHAQSTARVHAVAEQWGIPLHIMDLKKPFKRLVVDPFLRAYRWGLTPNPCVLCNRILKFQHLCTLAQKLHCDRIATGHYARIRTRRGRHGRSSMTLVEAKDPMKDQSYYLYRLSQKQLSLALFPLGTLTKDEVFAHAKRFKIPLERPSYRESQDLCFFPDASLNDFLSRYLREKPGPIKTLEGKTIGTHRGLPFYTIGQRRGLKVGGQSIPLYVVKKEQKNNTIFMASCRDNVENYARISSITFPSTPPAMNRRIPCEARIRSQGEKYHGSFIYRSLKGSFEFNSPVRNLTPGQSLVLYHGKEIIGGGIIEPKNAR